MYWLTHNLRFRRCTLLLPIIGLLIGASCKNDSTGPTTDAGNLISNPSFEVNGKPSYAGWHFADAADTAVSDDVPVLGGSWSLLMHPDWLPIPYARSYITGQSGRRVYMVSAWVKTANLPEPARIACGILQPDRTLRNEVHVNITGTDWSQYSLQDTLDLVATDTLVVELSPGAAQVVPIDAQALFDLIRLQRVF